MGTRSTDLSNFTYSYSQKTEFSSYGDIRQGPNARYGFPGEQKIISLNKNDITFQVFKKVLGSNKSPSLLLAVKTPGQRILIESDGLIYDETSNPFSN